jgi:hypothetical protein
MPSIKDRCIDLILQDKPEYAMILLLNSYDISDPHEMTLAYKMWANIKTEFHRREHHIHPDYNAAINDLLPRATPSDKQKLNVLLESSLHDKYKVYKLSHPYLSDYELDKSLKDIPPAIPAIYEFEPPLNFRIKARELCVKQDEHRIANGHQELCTLQEADQVLKKSIKLLTDYDKPVKSCVDCISLIVCLQIVTGRRFTEITDTCFFAPVIGNPFQATIEGVLKTTSIEPKYHQIPLLIKYDDVINNVRRVREFSNIHKLPNNYVKRVSQKMFGFPFVHGHLRNVYLELAWEYRHQSGFHSQATRAYFDSKALCHVPHLTSTMSYQKLQFL